MAVNACGVPAGIGIDGCGVFCDSDSSAAGLPADAYAQVQKVCIWTPDKDLAQCVVGDRVVQVDRRSNAIRNAAGVRAKFGVDPPRIPDYLALVGDVPTATLGFAASDPWELLDSLGGTAPLRTFPPRC